MSNSLLFLLYPIEAWSLLEKWGHPSSTQRVDVRCNEGHSLSRRALQSASIVFSELNFQRKVIIANIRTFPANIASYVRPHQESFASSQSSPKFYTISLHPESITRPCELSDLVCTHQSACPPIPPLYSRSSIFRGSITSARRNSRKLKKRLGRSRSPQQDGVGLIFPRLLTTSLC
jgi:hypothetical protein